MADCTQFLLENSVNMCQIFGWCGFVKPNPNQFSVFHTPLDTRTHKQGLLYMTHIRTTRTRVRMSKCKNVALSQSHVWCNWSYAHRAYSVFRCLRQTTMLLHWMSAINK